MLDLEGTWIKQVNPNNKLCIKNPSLGNKNTEQYQIVCIDNKPTQINLLIAEIDEKRFFCSSTHFGKTIMHIISLDEFIINDEKYQRIKN